MGERAVRWVSAIAVTLDAAQTLSLSYVHMSHFEARVQLESSCDTHTHSATLVAALV